ncbi:hypothetical protein LAZ67_1002176 [Cordylochernes scorpioides]|uniref:PiggyBac transposable element-derived protein domain-containing protein n=1 Tax=Cordylochernes scorpioides TaxID=51811 RepID=A0ABY6JVY6_9ARAC|nr:hypothetical protein LAZ67_1002176 [Cordylochernes scorpioides]
MTKGGVDMMNEMTATYNCARNSRRWPMVIFYSLLNIGAINSQIINFANGNASKVKSRRHFLKTLSLDLIEEMVKVRAVSGRMPCEIKEKASDIFNLLEPGPSKKPKIRERHRCKKCQKEKKGQKNYSTLPMILLLEMNLKRHEKQGKKLNPHAQKREKEEKEYLCTKDYIHRFSCIEHSEEGFIGGAHRRKESATDGLREFTEWAGRSDGWCYPPQDQDDYKKE